MKATLPLLNIPCLRTNQLVSFLHVFSLMFPDFDANLALSFALSNSRVCCFANVLFGDAEVLGGFKTLRCVSISILEILNFLIILHLSWFDYYYIGRILAVDK